MKNTIQLINQLTSDDAFPDGTLGKELHGYFLRNNIGPEREYLDLDIYSVLLRSRPTMAEEIAIHWYLLGNGKATFEGLLCIGLSVLLPGKISFFLKSYRKGKNALLFHQLDFSRMLHLELAYIRETFKIAVL